MRLFQNHGVDYPGYRLRLANLLKEGKSFTDYIRILLEDRYCATHILLPVLEGQEMAFFTHSDNDVIQRQWAREKGMATRGNLADILLAQIEEHRTEVLYDLDPGGCGHGYIDRLPGCVKVRIAWRAAPSRGKKLAGYDRIVCNFPGLLAQYERDGYRCSYFHPAHDPVMDEFAFNEDRPLDVVFVGGYSRYHARRAALLESLAKLSGEISVSLRLERSRLTKLAESRAGRLLPFKRHRRPAAIASLAEGPAYGIDLYRCLSKAKIVFNGAIDMAGRDRGNLRCWEALGCGALLLSDDGDYPPGMVPGRDLVVYRDPDDAMGKVLSIVKDYSTWRSVARTGAESIRREFSKKRQWELFEEIVAGAGPPKN